MKNNSYIGISAVLLIFGIWAVPKIVDRLSGPDLAIIGEKVVPDFSFTNQHGETITNEDYKGKVWVAEFFFSTCPDICPIMNRNMTTVQDTFFANFNFAIASFTIDPAHDTPEVLKEYAKSYNITKPQWHLLTGAKDKIFDLANAGFNLYVGEIPDSKGGFEHSGYFALIDQKGNIRSRRDKNDNPIIYYDGLEESNIKMLIEDIKKLL
jgi:protein SCO1/2